jgi:CO/xanthine dehydrogenase Mo-binding subunit
MVGEEMGVDLAMIRIVTPDTNLTPFDPGAYSSHTLFSVGNALRIACADLKRKLLEKASQMLDVLPENLEVKGGLVIAKDSGHRLRFTDLFSRGLMRFGAVTDAGSDFWGMGTWTVPVSHLDPLTWKVPGGRAGGFYSPAAEAAEVAVNLETGQIKVLRFVTVMNVGKAVNPALVEGQVEGSVAMGISCALAEELRIEEGRVVNPDLKDYKLISSLEASRMTFLPEESPLEEGPFGAKGVAEPAITGVAPAIGNAIWNAVGVRIADLPITREKILLALRTRPQTQR